ncbi:MAG: 3'-5' exonuclease [Pseudomonadota bacterium]
MRAWFGRLFGAAAPVALRAARWVVVDCETSGLDPARDRLLAVGAVAVRGGRIELGESFSAVLRQDASSGPANILVHGIGGEAQRNGRPAAQALREFSEFLGDGLPVGYHAPFDDAVLRRAMAQQPGLRAPRGWLDLAQLAPALHPGPDRARRALDDWLEEFGIACPARHDALADAYATAQLLLVLLAEAERQGAGTVDRMRRLERSGRWIGAS